MELATNKLNIWTPWIIIIIFVDEEIFVANLEKEISSLSLGLFFFFKSSMELQQRTIVFNFN